MSIFHLAIPSANLAESEHFYGNIMGFKIGRTYPQYSIFNFYGHQLVCHLEPNEIPQEVKMYPRHFGLIFTDKSEFENLYQRCKEQNVPFYQEMFERFPQKTGWHASFFIVDPHNNLLEFKWYKNPEDIG